jgi:AcrR family transcriptional regulator
VSTTNASDVSGTRARRQRRSGDEVRRLILDAALEIFEQHGYAQAKTKEIATAAGVSEPDIFRHFDSKAKLFERVVLGTVAGFMREYLARWDEFYGGRPDDLEKPAREWAEGMYAVLWENRRIMRVYLAAAAQGDVDGIPEGDDLLGRLLAEYERIGVEGFGHLQIPGVDVEVTLRACFGMIMSMAVYGDSLFPADAHPGRQRILDECTAMIVHGWLHRPV